MIDFTNIIMGVLGLLLVPVAIIDTIQSINKEALHEQRKF
jgi:hypothetical protein